MKSIGVTRSNAPILQKTAKRKIVRHPAKLYNILGANKGKGVQVLAISWERNNWMPPMAKENVSFDFRLKTDETGNYLLEEIKLNDLMCEKHEKVLNYFKHFLVFVSAVSECVSISIMLQIYWYSRIKNLCINCSN